MRPQVTELTVRRGHGHVVFFYTPAAVVLPLATAYKAAEEQDTHLIGQVIDLLVADGALEADDVEAHVLDVLHMGGIGLGVPASEHIPHVTAAAVEDVDTVDLVPSEGDAVDGGAVIRHLAHAELDDLGVPGLGVGDE